jgi:hypothetical protein
MAPVSLSRWIGRRQWSQTSGAAKTTQAW